MHGDLKQRLTSGHLLTVFGAALLLYCPSIFSDYTMKEFASAAAGQSP